ncbi:MAG TPA: c-type cytochrome domain-containing protein, partial [Gemmataceae bacterium]|nr:c-type cytochrome domain-containing protein [Gemmataceae bacterium]
MRFLSVIGCALLLALTVPGAEPAKKPSAGPQAVEFFEKRVRPLLADRCLSCHGPERQRGGLRLDTKQGLLRGSDNGPVVVPGRPEKSRLLQAVRHEGEVKMPPKGKLSPEAVADLDHWVRLGVPWPDGGTTPDTRSVAEVRRRHWAFQTVRRRGVPSVRNTS